MKRIFVYFLALMGASLLAMNGLIAQLYNQELLFPDPVDGMSTYQAIAEDRANDRMIAVTAINECPSCVTTDVNIQVFDGNGNVITSFRAGNAGDTEFPYGVALTDNPDEVIVVGSLIPQGTNPTEAFAMRVDLTANIIIWYESFDASAAFLTEEIFHGVEKLSAPVMANEEFFLYGIAQEVGTIDEEKIYLVKIDGNGNLIFSGRIFEHPNMGMNGAFLPSQMVENANGNYAMTGTRQYVNGAVIDRDIFLLEFAPDGTTVGSIQSYNVGSPTAASEWNENPRILADNNAGVYVLAFDSWDLPVGNNISIFTTVLLVDQFSQLIVGSPGNPTVYWDADYRQNHVSGVGINPFTGDYLIGTVHTSFNGGPGMERQGLLEVNAASLSAVQHTEYDPSYASLDGYTMIVGDLGVYHKTMTNNPVSCDVLHTDYSGGGINLACDFSAVIDEQVVMANRTKIATGEDNEYAVTDQLATVNQVGGNLLRCDGSFGGFKKPRGDQEQPALESNLELYPTLIDAATAVQLKWVSPEAGKVEIQISNLLGQVSYQATFTVGKGQNELQVPAAAFGPGVNLLRFSDDLSGAGETHRILRH